MAVVVIIFLELLLKSHALAAATGGLTFDIVNLGAKPDCKTDASHALQSAWARACASKVASTVYVPKGRFYVQSGNFIGPCNNNSITFLIDGTLVASSDFTVLAKSRTWISFSHINGLSIYGGVLDGQGTTLWACKNSGINTCSLGATTLEVSDSQNILINGLSSVNSQMYHIVVYDCQDVKIQGVKVLAASNSPNTDGIHVERSSNVAILNSNISTGDDCISIGPGTSHLWMERLACGPGHGISIGSLGKWWEEAGVKNVTLKTAHFKGTMNGVRIKSWGRPSNGSAKNILFQHIVLDNVTNPLIIDQNYCPHNQGCPNQASGVKISNVTYKDIRGTSATEVGINFECSPARPCNQIRLEDVKLIFKDQIAQAWCEYATGTTLGLVQPSNCLV
ncbi:polygalacturonase [Cucumis sativus]|uniref:Polygalacturonase n=1 Tax=Cucumis sativus TaxID=3659 RepID=A0A0A0LXR8_CUCSA|nr:polygalacturonase [Cucumis sativus]